MMKKKAESGKWKMRGSKVAILEHLRKYSWLTSRDAFEKYGITRLSARIKELRELGYDIRTVMVETTTRFGESCRYARYVLWEHEGEEK